jgi:lipopolysaccharide biosynthesis regulator YciM
MGAVVLVLLLGLGALAAGILIGRYYVPDDRLLRRTARHARAYMRTVNHLLARDTATAVDELRRIVGENIDEIEPYFALGALFRNRGEHERAIRVHQALALREGESRKLRVRAHHALGMDFRAAGMPRRATRAMEEVLIDEPRHEGALRALCGLYEEQGRYAEAAAAWSRLSRQRSETPTRREHHLLVAAAQKSIAAGDLDSAKRFLKDAGRIDDKGAHFLAAAAELAAARKNYRGASARLCQALETEPDLARFLVPGLLEAHRQILLEEGEGGAPIRPLADLDSAPIMSALPDNRALPSALPDSSRTRALLPWQAAETDPAAAAAMAEPARDPARAPGPDEQATPPLSPAASLQTIDTGGGLAGGGLAGGGVAGGDVAGGGVAGALLAPRAAGVAVAPGSGVPALSPAAPIDRRAAQAAAAALLAIPVPAGGARPPLLALAIAELESHADPGAALARYRAVAAAAPDLLPARVAAARLALASGRADEIAAELRALAGPDGALAWAFDGVWRCGRCGHRHPAFTWRCTACRRWGVARLDVGRDAVRPEPAPAAPRERRELPRPAPELLLGPSADTALALPSASLDSGLSAEALRIAGRRPSPLGRLGGWISGTWQGMRGGRTKATSADD